MTYRLGLTGSIGMGKSTTAAMFADQGCAVWDADAAVARLYTQNGAAVAPIAALFPAAVTDNAINRDALRQVIRNTQGALTQIEQIVHPLVREDRASFAEHSSADIIVFDVPLLFETGSDKEMDAVACVTISRDVQKQRVLDRGTMTEQDLEAILARQMPNEEKCRRSTFVIETKTLDQTRIQVTDIIKTIRKEIAHA